MAPLKAAKRRQIKSSQFVYPKTRDYPIDTLDRARSALRLGAKQSTKGSPSKIRSAVYRKYPQLKPGASKTSSRKSTSRKRATTRRQMARKPVSPKKASSKKAGAAKKASSKKASGKRS